MHVKSTQNLSSGQQAKKTSRKSSSTFSLPDGEAASETSQTLSTPSVYSMDALIALQTVDNIDPREHRRQAISHGQDVLDDLEKMKVALLSGRVSNAQLRTLQKRITERPDYFEDPGLKDLLDHIDLRARVELAKRNIF